MFSNFPKDDILIWLGANKKNKSLEIYQYISSKTSNQVTKITQKQAKKRGIKIPLKSINNTPRYAFYSSSKNVVCVKTIENESSITHTGKEKITGIKCGEGGSMNKKDRVEFFLNMWKPFFTGSSITPTPSVTGSSVTSVYDIFVEKINEKINGKSKVSVKKICKHIRYSFIHMEYYLGENTHTEFPLNKNNRYLINYTEYLYFTK